ncbi:hypothetical protein IQ268_09410 [Oculatella sp. LEGE 06141]|uniref:hypothetical protein n=1 Tax=Oculatella sp. LEGE 06141 TaxID=1828648 RepID=UPI0018815F07|nr:hypothetical protein [Oculatella sp. LEGE 06141]MBE9178775.1 hypothetical protein [Oculatella sp. LEGE 06141]
MQFGPGFTATFLYYFATTAILFTLLASQVLHLGTGTGIPQQVGILGGLIAGVLGAYFNRTTTFSVGFKNQKTFLKELHKTMQAMGYEQKAQEEDVLIYERPGLGKVLAGKVYVQLEPETVTIASRSIQLKRIQKTLS